MTTRKAISEIPAHLKPFTTEQDPSLYSWIDHAGWRFIMLLSTDYFSERAHPIYLEGLKATGISVDRIPLISEMDDALKKFGWRAVNVSGFIPPAAFLEFMELGILPIACEMRKVENLNYTPAPDIVHEAAGHAPILADVEYADYVKSYGYVASRAIFSKKDLKLFEAIRALSDTKEKPTSTKEQIDIAQKNFEIAYSNLDYVSESTQLARMSWWTIEYGMIGDLNKPLLYGAGLLSSLGESYHAFDSKVKKIPLSIDCIYQAYDITRPQPQLFVAPNVSSMRKILDDYAETMAFKRGGSYALGKAKHAETTTTTVLDTNLHITGIVKNFSYNPENDHPLFLNIQGPLQLCFNNKQISGWESHTLPQTLLSPLGDVAEFWVNNEASTKIDSYDFTKLKGSAIKVKYSSGIYFEANIDSALRIEGKNFALKLSRFNYYCSIEQKHYKLENTLVLIGKKVVSVYGGACDRLAFHNSADTEIYKSNTHQANYNMKEHESLINAYYQVRKMRELKKADSATLQNVLEILNQHYPHDWLLRWELLELNTRLNLEASWEKQVLKALKNLQKNSPDLEELIDRGFSYLEALKNRKTAA